MTFICRSWRSSPWEQREGCRLVIYDLVMNIALGARLARKCRKVRVTERGSPPPPLFSPLFRPCAPTAESIVRYSAIWVFFPRYHTLWHICLGFLLSWSHSDHYEYVLRACSTPSYLETKSYSLKPKSLSLPNYYPQNIACPRFSPG